MYIQTDKNQVHDSELHCSSCEALLGVKDASAEGWRIYKSSLSVKPSLDAEWETSPREIFISSQLLALIESSAARKFVVHDNNSDRGILVS